MDLDYAALGKRIRTIRKKKQMTQEYLAEQVGIEPSNISHIERAASKVGLGTLVKIANALQCSVTAFCVSGRHLKISSWKFQRIAHLKNSVCLRTWPKL